MRFRLPAALLTLSLALVVAPAATADPSPDPGGPVAKARATDTAARRTTAVAALDKARDILSGKGDPDRVTMALRNLWATMDALSPAQQSEAKALLARPSLPQERCSTPASNGWSTCVHYTTFGGDAVDATDADANGTPDYVDLTLATIEHVHDVYYDAGYREPLPDGGTNGSDALDVFLEDDGSQGYYGYCAPDQDTPQGVYTSWSYCSFDNDFDPAQFPTNTPSENLQVTAAHEYFHATQFAYDAYEDTWLLEATATWAEDELYDGVDDNLQYLDQGPMGQPQVPLDLQNGIHKYGAWIFFRYLTERFPDETGGLPTFMLDLWDRLDSNQGHPDNYSVQGLVKELASRGTSMAKELGHFAVNNRFPADTYAQGSLYPTAPATSQTLTAGSHNPAAFARTLNHLSTSTVRYVSSGLSQSNWRLRLAFNLAPKSYGSTAMVAVVKTSGDIEWGWVKLDSDGDAKVSVPFSSSDVASVEVTLVNAGTAYKCWSGGKYACSGSSKDDGLKDKVDPVAYRS